MKSFRNTEAAKLAGEQVDFSFGENWKRFLLTITPDTIARAENDFRKFTGLQHLRGKTFLDIGCGSGLNSLIATRMGADRVVSIDIDPNSVAAANALRTNFGERNSVWEILHGSILDPPFMQSLGQFSYVLSWGVLHHTGQMWQAIDNAAQCVLPLGQFHIALYNWNKHSKKWLSIKRIYNASPWLIKRAMLGCYAVFAVAVAALHGIPPWRRRQNKKRGMSIWRDHEDWLGGLPYEYCSPEQVVNHLAPQGYFLCRLRTTWSIGCNEYMFEFHPEFAQANHSTKRDVACEV